jgi:hypothetical protein
MKRVWGCRETGNLLTAFKLRFGDDHMQALRLFDVKLELSRNHLSKQVRVNDRLHQ